MSATAARLTPPPMPTPSPAPSPPRLRMLGERLGARTRPRRAEDGGSFWRKLGMALLGSVVITVGFGGALGWFGDDSAVGVAKSMSYGIAIGVGLWLACSYLNSWLSRAVDWLDRPWRSFLVTVVANVAAIVAVRFAIDAVFLTYVYPSARRGLIERLYVENYVSAVLIALFITAIYQGAFFLRLWKERFRENEQLRTANLAAKYEALNAQINPHFLFNSLNVLSSLVRTDAARAEGFIQGLSAVYRYVLEVRQEPSVPVARELAALRAYGELVRTRFGPDRIDLDIHLGDGDGDDGDDDGGRVVPLALQMLVENAVKHNGATRARPLRITVAREGDYYAVRNNRVALFEPAAGSGIGLDNIRERYRLNGGAEVIVEASDESFAVKLPVLRA